MLNGRKNAVIGVGVILTIVLLELAAIFTVAALFLHFIVGVDLPIFSRTG
jgi:hypothetical protein